MDLVMLVIGVFAYLVIINLNPQLGTRVVSHGF